MNLSISMNNGMNNAMHATASPRAASGAADAPTAGVAPDGSGVLPSAELASVPQAMPFQQWIAADAPLPEFVSVPAAEGAPVDSVAPAQPTDQEDQDDPAGLAVGADQSAVFDTRFTTMAMAMALPISPAAMPAMMMAMAGTKTDAANDGTGTTAGTSVGMPAAVAAAGAGIASPASTVLTALTESRAVGASPALADAAASPAPTARVLATPALPDTAAGAAHSASATALAGTPAASAGAESARSERIEAAPASAASVIAGTAIQPAPARGADSLTLTGPPSAWRQSLHEALGERLQLQIGRNAEQATIRLDPPMLGRIDISVRHSGGNLEVHIAATNTEVLRQLNTVSDSLRNDLAGRQYSNVSVNVTEAPRAQASTQAGNQPSGQPGADAQGRGRQQEQEQARTPGLALNDAGEAGSLFSLYSRD
jgi:flagellar hook-length control protein FliK